MIELTRAGIGIKKLCRLPMYDEAVQEMQRGSVEVGRGRSGAPS